ncbi:ABC-type oligopeptide transport system substrate-binding subunit [Dysgonomonas hofstadii]|uniref:ABC-type oligopeptide transport system substrate-binding subunit n=1 Tax=Dysgonomonas hofstadii TaxID=637886 RepID=A0A840CR80_9BACT|nr:hypothetical protein [Dysgonomonas hofstadii]MBB4035435.1 ABC-type oligopeptide transport system substrate-binding subunit [Dysgonomonas hofstadii]
MIKMKNKILSELIALSVLLCLLGTSCKKQQPEPLPEIKEYYDPYAPVPKSKFDSVKVAQALSGATDNDSLLLLTEKMNDNERDY